MSRIGKMPIVVPEKVKVTIENGILSAKGPLGEMHAPIPDSIKYTYDNNTITFSRESEYKKVRALHGLTRALCFNAVIGVTTGFTKTLQLEGVGFKTELKGQNLQINVGFSHPVLFIPPNGIKFETPNANTIKISGVDKQVVGQISAKIRQIRPPEPYKGKGIRYEGEYIRRKAGKTASK
ncbi:MAG: 50S ribosomal protein L6 [Ignavibacteria bacterium]|jgi:large subunit ribosomal protein L6|nr:50S ribosomal protein L6 [Ignavibacteria bacterium]